MDIFRLLWKRRKKRLEEKMNEDAKQLVSHAEALIEDSRYTDAGRCYERASESVHDKETAAALLIKASEAFRKPGSFNNAARCCQKAAELLEGKGKAVCLMASWQILMDAIAAFEYDCGFEWRGETNGSHDSYLHDIERYANEATDVLRQALRIDGVDANRIIKQAEEKWKEMKEGGGWGATRCWDIIQTVDGERKC
jgi:tetratricopeptide (TPR) repeat protein